MKTPRRNLKIPFFNTFDVFFAPIFDKFLDKYDLSIISFKKVVSEINAERVKQSNSSASLIQN